MANIWLGAYRIGRAYVTDSYWNMTQAGSYPTYSTTYFYNSAQNNTTSFTIDQGFGTMDTTFVGNNSAYITNIALWVRPVETDIDFTDDVNVYIGGTYNSWVDPSTLGTRDAYFTITTAEQNTYTWRTMQLTQADVNSTGDTEVRFVPDSATLASPPASGEKFKWYLYSASVPSDYMGFVVDYEEGFEHLDIDAEGNLQIVPADSGHYLIRDTTNPNGFKRVEGSERGVMEALVYTYDGWNVSSEWHFHYYIREYQGDAPPSFL